MSHNAPLLGNVNTLVIGNFVLPGGIQYNSFPDSALHQVERVIPTPPPSIPPAPKCAPVVQTSSPTISLWDKARFDNTKRFDGIDLSSPDSKQDFYTALVRKSAFECDVDWQQALVTSKSKWGVSAEYFVSLETQGDNYKISFNSAEALCEFMESIDVIFLGRKTYNLYYRK